MSASPSRDVEDRTEAAIRRRDRECDRFETAWKAGKRPRLEDYLTGVPAPERAALLRDLIVLEIDYRRLSGEHPTAAEFLERFPDLDQIWIGNLLSANAPTVSTVPPGAAPSPAPPAVGATQAAGDVPPELAHHARYQILRVLGCGGMGVVFQAMHRLMERPVALKVIRGDYVRTPQFIERFRQEVKAAARLSHPNIVAAYDAEQAGDLHFLVMEYVDGVNLAHLAANKGPLDVGIACDYARQAALGLQHAFTQGMIHRDIKPHNLMLTRDGQVKILDFGLARLVREQQAAEPPLRGEAPRDRSLTAVGALLGTPDFMAPEQARDARQADIRADIYSLGCTLYSLLSGQPPFPEGGALTKVLSHLEQSPRPLPELRAEVPPSLAAVVKRMMAPDPAKRFQTPAEAALALAPFVRRQGTAATQPSGQRASAPAAVSRRPWMTPTALGVFTAASVVVLALAILLGFWQHRGAAAPQPTPPTTDAPTPPPSPSPQPAPPAAKGPSVLIVLPQKEFWYPEYDALRTELDRAGFATVVASSKLGLLTAVRRAGAPDDPGVTAAVLLDEANADDYDAVVFLGGNPSFEYARGGAFASAARTLLQNMIQAKKIVAAVGRGVKVLADAGVLEGREATYDPFVFDGAGAEPKALWTQKRVVVSGRIITGRDSINAPQVAQELAAALQAPH